MRPIHEADLDKVRPVLVLTREIIRPHLKHVTVAPITTVMRGLSTEVPVGIANGVDADSVISCENVTTIPSSALGRNIGYLLPAQEESLSAAVRAAFDLE
ncbi:MULTISPECIES: type II toxin-antitoxin system PemK/MazF family toxin [Rhodococcus]|jgi:mRNA interferase MazF|uniref:type II toxin-antitoxin system PemK/MazF family toxin n=1 Tax=Rhodococcus TaxID=1827 RepID=UPI00071D5B0D|nr:MULTISPECIES: type II toxin-antitoxin system PemK/MazF family toxin [Rhodococcus]ANQ75717.1 mRNA interferase MazF3 [Rhodococcus sp. 008]KSU68409.1 mRNA interferase MazF3 [Rhodococcus qingshengii]SCC68862.1 mRNA interferase MazF [Rhodococcus qingshengii]